MAEWIKHVDNLAERNPDNYANNERPFIDRKNLAQETIARIGVHGFVVETVVYHGQMIFPYQDTGWWGTFYKDCLTLFRDVNTAMELIKWSEENLRREGE